MKKLVRPLIYLASLLAGATLLTSPVLAARSATTTAADTTLTAAQQQRLSDIKTRGNTEIERRLASLNKALTRISAASKLSAANKTMLTTEVQAEITGLTALKAKLAGETTLDAARTDAQSILSDYRVYALVLPKVWLTRAADAEQVTEDKLTALAAKLQTRLTEAKAKNKDVTALQAKLDDMTAKIKSAQDISKAVEAKLLPLQPSDYNSDHSILSGSLAQLKQAHLDNKAAYDDAKAIRAGLK